jgi:hypothetical protein
MKPPFWIWLTNLYYPAFEASTLSGLMSEGQVYRLTTGRIVVILKLYNLPFTPSITEYCVNI